MVFHWLRNLQDTLVHTPRLRKPRPRRAHPASVPAMVQQLEPRVLLSITPVGPEFKVNTFTTGSQSTNSARSVASDDNGNFVVAWTSSTQDAGGSGVYAQRYDNAGNALGAEFRVNTFTTNAQLAPAVAMDADGDFIVVWASNQDGSSYGIYAQRYNAAGAAQGGEFRVNTVTANSQNLPSVAMDDDGDFVVAWTSSLQDGSGNGVYAQRYNASGVAQGIEFRVNTFTTVTQDRPHVAMDADGDFVVVWRSNQDGSGYGIYAQRYNAAGAAQGSEFRTNTYTTSTQESASVGMDADGNFVVAWSSYGQDGNARGIFSQRYNAAGVAQGSEFRVNTETTGDQQTPSVAVDADGDFIIAFDSVRADGSGAGIAARSYTANGIPLTSEFQVNTFTTLTQNLPAIAIDASGDFVVVWTSQNQDSATSLGVYAQRFQGHAFSSPPIVDNVRIGGETFIPGADVVGPITSITVQFSEEMSTAGGASGPTSVTNPANWNFLKDAQNANALISGITQSFNGTLQRYEATLTFSAALAPGNYSLTAKGTMTDVAGNGLDGDLDGPPGGNFTRSFLVGGVNRIGSETVVNTFLPGTQITHILTPSKAVATDLLGNTVVTWSSLGQDGSGYGVYAQRFSSAGTPVGSEFRVNSFTTGDQDAAAVAMDADGDFVITWTSFIQDGNSDGVYAQRYNAAGVAQGGEFQVNTFTTNAQSSSTIAMDADGDFVITWFSNLQDGSGPGVFAQRYSANGVAQGSEFQVNTSTLNAQWDAVAAMDADGDFVVVWSGLVTGGTGGFEIVGQRYAANGTPQGTEFVINTFTTGVQRYNNVSMDEDGDFVVTWSSAQDGSGYGVYARRYNAAGVAQGGAFQVNTSTLSNQQWTNVGMKADGDFVVTWTTLGPGQDEADAFAQRYAADGTPRGGEFRAHGPVFGAQAASTVAIDSFGDFTIVWSHATALGEFDVYLQRFDDPVNPTVIVDDGDPTFFTAGGWTTYGSSGRGSDVRYVHNGAAPTTATWQFDSISSGVYRVSATWPGADASVRATNAPFTIRETVSGPILHTALVNQIPDPNDFTDDGSAWEDLGVVKVIGNSLFVQLTNFGADNYVIADAIRIERLGDVPMESEIAVEAIGIGGVNDGTGMIDYGDVPQNGGPVPQTYRIYNVGTTNLVLQPATAPTGFTITTNAAVNQTITPGSFFDIVVQLDATSVGPFSGEVSFATNDTDENPFNFTVSGDVFVPSEAPGADDHRQRRHRLHHQRRLDQLGQQRPRRRLAVPLAHGRPGRRGDVGLHGALRRPVSRLDHVVGARQPRQRRAVLRPRNVGRTRAGGERGQPESRAQRPQRPGLALGRPGDCDHPRQHAAGRTDQRGGRRLRHRRRRADRTAGTGPGRTRDRGHEPGQQLSRGR